MGTVGDAALIASMAGSPVATTTSGRAANASRANSGIHARARESVEQRLAREAEERVTWERLAEESETARVEIAARLTAVQAAAERAPKSQTDDLLERGEAASKQFDLDEAATRALIDQQLRDAGWEADTALLRYAAGTRPARGRNMAIAEWPTATGPA